MVFVDKLSKFVCFAPTTTDVSSVDAAHIFADRVVSLFGLPKKLITGRDTRFTSNMFTEFCHGILLTLWHSECILNCPPFSDRRTDREIQCVVLEDMLRHYVGADQSNRDDLLP